MKNILVVDDMPDWREQLKSILQRDGFVVDTASSYGEALGALNQQKYLVVIVDLRLSPSDETNRDGMKLLKNLAKTHIPSIVVTGYGSAEIAQQAFRDLGTVQYFEKNTIDLRNLRQAVREQMKRNEERERELSELRARFLRGEIVSLPTNLIDDMLTES